MAKGLEAWWKSRRIWSALLAAICAVSIQLGYPVVATTAVTIGGVFGITSWVKPK